MSGVKGQKSGKATVVPKKYSKDFLDSMDGRCVVVKALKQRYQALRCDLGSDLSYQQVSIMQRVVHIEALIEDMEHGFIDGKPINVNQYTNLINSLVGLLKTLGLQRHKKDVPALNDYIEGK